MLVVVLTLILSLAILGTTNVSYNVYTDPWFGYSRYHQCKLQC